jgi:tetratricopeptide (TPR) repeat protein
MAGVGFLGAIALWSLSAAVSKKSARIVIAVVCIMLLSLEYAANIRRQFIWQQPATLWTDVLRQFPRLSQAHIGVANVHGRAGDHRSALASANEAILHASGQWAEPHALRAIALWQTGNNQDALESFRHAQSLSRVYDSTDAMASALFFSVEQLDVLGVLLRESRVQGPSAPSAPASP